MQLTHPNGMLREAATTVRRARAIRGHRPTSAPAEVREASAPYYGDGTNHLLHNAYTANTAAHLHSLMHNHQAEVREVFTLTLRKAH